MLAVCSDVAAHSDAAMNTAAAVHGDAAAHNNAEMQMNADKRPSELYQYVQSSLGALLCVSSKNNHTT